MKIIDISMPIYHDMAVYKGKEEKRPHITVQSDFTTGSAYESRIDMNMHTGTHLDRSLHIFPGGTTIESLNLEKVITKCRVIDLSDADDRITADDLHKKHIEEGDFVLLKTKNSFLDILEGDFIFLDRSGAQYLKDKKIKGVGTDGLGIERSQPGHETHKMLLEMDIVIIEGLRLKDVEEGEYFLSAAPILIPGVEGAPLRAVLIKDFDFK